MRKKHNGFVKFMRKRDCKKVVDPDRPIKIGDKVLVKGIELSALTLGRPDYYVGEVRVVHYVSSEYDYGERYRLSDTSNSSWYLAEDLELVS